ncbi:MAG: hypothetical protein ACXABZ_13335, partial [Candidatus Thorarchaeota archaeon]
MSMAEEEFVNWRCLLQTAVLRNWRVTPSDMNTNWDQVSISEEDILGPEELLDATLMANLRTLGGYNPKAGARVPEDKYQEARDPKHVAISLAGEPTLYPYLSEFIDVISRRGMTSFLVTNGTRPDVLSEMSLPTQLYVTLAAPDEETHMHLLRPGSSDAWQRLNESQE